MRSSAATVCPIYPIADDGQLDNSLDGHSARSMHDDTISPTHGTMFRHNSLRPGVIAHLEFAIALQESQVPGQRL